MLQRNLTTVFAVALLGSVGIWSSARASSDEWLSLCGKCLSPSVISKSGAGTAHAVAEARITRQGAAGWCSTWQPSNNPEPCAREQLAEAGNKLYRATANCLAGRLTAIDEKSYVLAGAWGPGIGEGRTRWRNPSTGNIVGRDEASGGLALSQQWEVLCPARAAAPPGATGRSTLSGAELQTAQLRTGNRPEPSRPLPPPICAGRPRCDEAASFAGTITDFRTSVNGRFRVLIVGVRFQNKLSRPLILGYVQGSGVATDDQGNRFEVFPPSVRGIGTVNSSTVDPKFVLQPGESSDGQFEFGFAPGRQILGTVYDLDISLREINPLAGNQFRLGLEHAMHYRRLSNAPAPVAAEPAPQAEVRMAPAAASAPLPEPEDLCGGKARCYSAGPFLAEVTQITPSQAAPGAHHVIRFAVRFRNASHQPIVLGYKAGSSTATDNYGNPYYCRRPGTVDTSSSGIGVVTGSGADPSFRLNPGEAREASFQIIRFSPGRTALGSAFTWSLVVENLEVLPGNQVRSTREYNLNFQNLNASLPNAFGQPSESLGDAAKRLKGLFTRKK